MNVMNVVQAKPLTKEAFRAFGDVIDKECDNQFLINNGNCMRHNDLADIELDGENAKAIISIFEGKPCALPHTLDMVERHPLGSQAFVPMHGRPFLVIVCEDDDGRPINPQAFITQPNQGINLKKNVWHGVLTPLFEVGDFLVVDRAGDGNNLQEHHFDDVFSVEVADSLLRD